MYGESIRYNSNYTINIGYSDGCSEDNTSLPSGEINWPESDIGMVNMLCPCGTVNISLTATRFCFGNFDERAEWGDANTSSCNFSGTALELCRISNVSLPVYNHRSVFHDLTFHSIQMSSVVAAESLQRITANATELQPVEITIAAAIVEQLTEDAATNPNVCTVPTVTQLH